MKHSKKSNEAYHFKCRLLQRYKININRKVYRALCIQAKTAKKIEIQSNRISIRRVEYIGISIIVVYDKQRERLVTCLTEEQYADLKRN